MKYPSNVQHNLGQPVVVSRQELEFESQLVASVLLAMHVSACGADTEGPDADTNGLNTLADNINLLDTAVELRKFLRLNAPSKLLFSTTAESIRSITIEELAWLPINTRHKTDRPTKAFITPSTA